MPDAEFELKHEAVDELKRLAAHPVQEVERLEKTALEGRTAALILIIVAGIFVGVSLIAAAMYGLVELVTWLVEG
jgi:hypothetical protein